MHQKLKSVLPLSGVNGARTFRLTRSTHEVWGCGQLLSKYGFGDCWTCRTACYAYEYDNPANFPHGLGGWGWGYAPQRLYHSCHCAQYASESRLQYIEYACSVADSLCRPRDGTEMLISLNGSKLPPFMRVV